MYPSRPMREAVSAINPEDVLNQMLANIEAGDGSKKRLCEQFGVSYQQLSVLLGGERLGKMGRPVKMTDEVKASADRLLHTGMLNRDSQFARWLGVGHDIEISRFVHFFLLVHSPPSY